MLVIVLPSNRHTDANSGSGLRLRINHNRPTQQPDSFLHVGEAQTSASPWCFDVESGA
jgi:hypothetical protein